MSLPASVAAGGLTEAAHAPPVAPPAAHVHVEGRLARETVWNPLEGDPLRMAALGAAAEVQQGGWVAQGPPAGSGASDNGNGAVVKGADDARASRRGADTAAAAATARTAPPGDAAGEPAVGASTTPPGARLRPVTGRRQREPLPATISITAGSYRSNLSPPMPGGGGAPAAAAAAAGAGTVTTSASERDAGAWAPWSVRARVLVGLAVALLAAAGAAAAIVVTMPPRAELQASLAYERDAAPDGAPPGIDDRALREFRQAQETLLWSKEVRDAAAESLAKRGADSGPGFLANVHVLARSGRVRWDANADHTREELTLAYATRAADAGADAERLRALFHALRAAALARGSGGRVGELKLQLLEGEVADYARELEYLERRLRTLQEELRILRLGAPKEGEVETLKGDAARLSAAYQNALAERIRAEVEAGVAPKPAAIDERPPLQPPPPQPPLPSPTTAPAGGGAAAVLPPPQAELAPAGVGQLRRIERDVLVELRAAEKHLAEAAAQQEAIEQKERELNGVNDTIGSLSRSLGEKRKELAEAGRSRQPAFEPLAPSPPRVVEEQDERPLWIGVAVAAASICFAGYVALLSRGRGGDRAGA
jgi:hypothetical protein